MREAIARHKVAYGVLAVLGVGVAAFLAFGFFGVQALFTNKTVNEAGPVFSSSAPADQGSTDGSATPAAGDAPAPEPSTAAQGTFKGADASHEVSGTATVLTNGAQRVLRLTDFKATNGPDLKVYLRAADGDYVSLGKLKGNIGDQNYDIPADVDLDTHNEVQIWCERFAVNFGSANLT